MLLSRTKATWFPSGEKMGTCCGPPSDSFSTTLFILPSKIPLQAIYIMYCCIRVAVYRHCFCCNKQFAAVRSKAVAVELLEWTLAGSSRIEQHFYRFTCLERVFDDLCLIRIHLRIMFAVSRNRDDTRNVLRDKFSGYDFFQIEWLAVLGKACQCTKAEKKCKTYFFISLNSVIQGKYTIKRKSNLIN